MKRCKICGTVFNPTNNNQKYCSISVDNKTVEKIKSVDLITKTNANKFVFSTGETLFEKKDILSLHFVTKKEENA